MASSTSVGAGGKGGADEKKIVTFIKKGYIVPPGQEKLKPLIKYFAVPKGVLDGKIQDWRIVFHAGAN